MGRAVILRIVRCAAAVLALLAPRAVAFGDGPPIQIDCAYKYRLVSRTDVRICSCEPLDDAALARIVRDVRAAQGAYRGFALRFGVSLGVAPALARVDVALVSRRFLNDARVWHTADAGVIGRHFPGDRRVYVDVGSFLAGVPVLTHELGHMLNHLAGIEDRAMDEQMAYAFEATAPIDEDGAQ